MAKRKKKSLGWAIGGVVIIGTVVGLSFLTLDQNIVYFYTPSEAQAKSVELSSQKVRVGGMVMPGSVEWRSEEIELAFTLTDFKGHEISVAHSGTPPDLFKENQGVVVEGWLASSGDSMRADRLMVKHSEEYQKPEDAGSMDKELLQQSLFKNEAAKKGSDYQDGGSSPAGASGYNSKGYGE